MGALRPLGGGAWSVESGGKRGGLLPTRLAAVAGGEKRMRRLERKTVVSKKGRASARRGGRIGRWGDGQQGGGRGERGGREVRIV